MRKGRVVLVLGIVLILGGWWVLRSSPRAHPEKGVIDVWATWAEDPGQLQRLFDRYSLASGISVRVITGLAGEEVSQALASPAPPDLAILSGSDLIGSYHQKGLVEPLNPWIEAKGIDLDDIYPAPLAPCLAQDGSTVCLPWGCDVFALFWNKDMFEAASLDPERAPKTAEELVAYAGKLTLRDDEDRLSQLGFIPDFPRAHTELYARLFGGSWASDDGTELTINSGPMIDAANWQLQFYEEHGTAEVQTFVSSLDRYLNSSHPRYAGRRFSCQQCHRAASRVTAKVPDRAFYDGEVAMMVGGQWQVWPGQAPAAEPGLNYGLAPFPPPADHPERANTVVVEGPVVVVPVGASDREAAADLLAWMMSPEIVAEAAFTHASLPTSRLAAQDPRFHQTRGIELFMALLAQPNAKGSVTTAVRVELNEALGSVEGQLLHGKGGVPMLLLNEVQAQLAPRLKEVAACRGQN